MDGDRALDDLARRQQEAIHDRRTAQAVFVHVHLRSPAPHRRTAVDDGPRAGSPRATDVIALERAALDRWGRGDPQGFLETYAPDITYFDPSQATRVDGLEAMKQLLGPIAGKIRIHRYEMLNPKVQHHGDLAVLTYNVVNYIKKPDGSESVGTRWNSTSVFRRDRGRWRTIHSHFSFTKPEVKQVGAQ